MGQLINMNKSEIMVSPNMSDVDRSNIESIFQTPIVEKPGIYLGSDLDLTKWKGVLFNKITHRLLAKLASWKIPLLSFAGRVTLVKHYLLTIPSYLLAVFKAPSYFFQHVQSIATRFLWKQNKDKGIC